MPRRLWLGSDGSVAIDGGESKQIHAVVSRGLCLFLTLDATKVPTKQRKDFVALAVRRAAPFFDPDHAVSWFGDHACVWYWSKSRILGLLGTPEYPITRFLPESILLGSPPDTDTEELLSLRQGAEGRIWRQGRLLANRWWPKTPEVSQWQDFLRSAGQTSNIPCPQAQYVDLAQKPWLSPSKIENFSLGDRETLLNQALWLAGILGFAVLGYEAGAGIRGISDASAADKSRESLDESIEKVLQARSNAEQASDDIRQLLKLHPPRRQLELLTEINRVMTPIPNWQLSAWDLQDPEQLEVTLVMSKADPAELVAAWESSPMFSDVNARIDEDNQHATIKARIAAEIPVERQEDSGGSP